jgi:hypothetical protein
MIDKEFIPYKQALALKELGFDEPCLGVLCEEIKMVRINDEPRNWNDNVRNGETTSAPLYQQAFRWFRDKHNIFASVDVNYCYKVYFNDEFFEESNTYNSYKEAELECLKKLIEIVKNAKNSNIEL